MLQDTSKSSGSGKNRSQLDVVISENSDIINIVDIEMFRKSKIGKAEPMPKKQFLKIEKRFKARGGVFQYSDEMDEYLKKRNAEAITYNSKTILFRKDPSRASVFEELIHATQYKNGENDGSYISRLKCEIVAQKKLIKYSKAYNLTELEIRQTQEALKAYENELNNYNNKKGGNENV